MLDEFLKNELSFNREAGTYLFYGDDLEKNYRIALEFSAALFSRNIENEDEKSKIKDKTLRNLYSDLMVVDNLNIDTVRDIIKKTYTSSHEGGAKVFILKNIQDIRKESANAMLKIIEEPTRDNFFILDSCRNVTVHDSLGQSFYYCSFTDTSITDENWIILCATRKNFRSFLDFFTSSAWRILPIRKSSFSKSS